MPYQTYGMPLPLAIPPPSPLDLKPLPRVVPFAAATNLTAATAIDIGTVLPYTTQQNVNFGGTTQTVWYQYTAQPGDVVIGIFGFGALGGYQPNVTIWSPDASTRYPYASPDFSATNKPLQIPVIVGNRYYIRCLSTTGNVTSAILSFSVRRAPQNAVPAGAIFLSSDTAPFAAAALSPIDATVLRFLYPFPAGESGDTLNTGEACFNDGNANAQKFYDSGLKEVAATTLPFAGFISSNKTSTFYLGDPGVFPGNAQATTASKVGVQGPTTWTFTDDGLGGLAPSPDETILYYDHGALNGPVKRWDLVANAALSDLAGAQTGFETDEIIVLADGTIVVAYWKSATASRVIRYSPAGVVLQTFDYVLGAASRTRLARGLDDPASFWIWLPLSSGLAQLKHLQVSDGTELLSLAVTPFNNGVYQPTATATPAAFFGPDNSCPLVLIRAALANAPCPSIT